MKARAPLLILLPENRALAPRLLPLNRVEDVEVTALLTVLLTWAVDSAATPTAPAAVTAESAI